MSIRDLCHQLAVLPSVAPAVRTTGTTTGSAVDLKGYDAALICVAFGAYTDGTHTPSVQHSVDGTTYTNVAAADLDGAFTAVAAAGGANTVQKVGYIGAQRFVRVVMTVASATSGAASAASVVAGYPHQAPV